MNDNLHSNRAQRRLEQKKALQKSAAGIDALDRAIAEKSKSYHDHNAYHLHVVNLFRRHLMDGQSALELMRVCPKCERYCLADGPEHAFCEKCGRVKTSMTVATYMEKILGWPASYLEQALAEIIAAEDKI